MIHTRPTAASPTPAANSPAADTAAWRLDLLVELTEIGMELARAVRRDVAAAAEEAAPAEEPASPEALAAAAALRRDLCLAFSRVSRAVRQTLGLHARLEADVATPETAASLFAAEAAGAAERLRVKLAGAMRKGAVERTVREAIQAEAGDPAEVHRLVEALDAQLDRGRCFNFRDQPIGEMVAAICRDLGLQPDWNRWAFEDWAREEAEARPEGSPFAAGDRSPSPDDDEAQGGTRLGFVGSGCRARSKSYMRPSTRSLRLRLRMTSFCSRPNFVILSRPQSDGVDAP